MAFILHYLSKRNAKKEDENPHYLENIYPVPEDLMEEFDVPYTGQDGASLAMDIYKKKDAGSGKLPVIVLIHGGGLMVGKPIMERKVCEYLARKGFLVFAPGYRMVTDADGCGEIGDICDAFTYIHKNLKKYGGDRNRVYVISESAGVYLAIYAIVMKKSTRLCRLLGKTPSRLSIKAMACVSGMFYITKKDLLGFLYPRDIFPDKRKNRRFMKYMNPEHEDIMSKLPPLILTSSKADFLRKYTIQYAKALRKARHQSMLVYYGENKELIHAFPTLKPDLPESKEALEKIIQWFEKYQ